MKKKLIVYIFIFVIINLFFINCSYSFTSTGNEIMLAVYSLGNKVVGAHDDDLKELAENFKESYGYTEDILTDKMKFVTTIECANSKGTKVKIGTGKYAETIKIDSKDLKKIYGYPDSEIKKRNKLACCFDCEL